MGGGLSRRAGSEAFAWVYRLVVMSAAHGLHALTERLLQRGVRAVVTKPFDATALIALVGQYASPSA